MNTIPPRNTISEIRGYLLNRDPNDLITEKEYAEFRKFWMSLRLDEKLDYLFTELN